MFAVAGVLSLHAAEEGMKQGKATVRSVHGTVDYQADPNGAWMPVRPNMKFPAGVTFRTGPDGTADISVNGTASAVRITNSTVLQIPTMSYVGSAREGDTTTMLNLQTGSVIGNVKKITANSRYEIMSPHGVAGIRGTDFGVDAIPLQDGKFDVTFKSITGVITVSAIINGVTVTHTLTTGTLWHIGDNPRMMNPDMLEFYQNELGQLNFGNYNNYNNNGGLNNRFGNPNNGTPNPVVPPVSNPGGTGTSS
jgi:hypothetical protein